MPTYKSAASSSNYKHPNNNQSNLVQMQMINSPPPSLNRQRRTQSTGSPEYQQYQRKERRGPLHLSQSPENWDRDSNSNSNTNSSVHSSRKGSSLVPIWALHSSVDTNKRIDHSTKATGVSTSEPLKKKSPILNNSAMGSTGMMASRRNPNAISQYSGGTKFWIRSGNKWIITKNGNGNGNIHGENTSNAGSMNVSTGTSSGGAGGGKIHPTAVSSYGTNLFNEQSVQKINSSSQRRISPSRTNNAHVRNNSGNGNHMTQTYDAASAISSFASSSMAGLYTRQRMTKTPGGFPYLPALHLMKKNENGGNEHNNINGNGSGGGSGGLGISSGTGIARSGMGGGGIMYGVNDQAHGGRFQRSYLLNAKPISSPISNKGIFSEEDEHEIGNSGGGIESMYRSPQNAIDAEDHRLVETRSGVPSGLQRQTSSGYDSEREERLREWKEQFVQKFIENPSGASPRDNGRSLMSSTTIIRRTKSLDSDCDSECHTNQMRLVEWKEEQYKRSAKLKYSKGSVGAGSYLRPPVKQQSQGFSFSFANPVALRADNLSPSMQSSFSSNYDERLNEWKEEQYASFGSNRNVDNDNEEYDSDSTRKQRVKEWKRQFAHVDAPLPKGMESAELSVPPSRLQRHSSTYVETGAVNANRNHHTQDGGQSLDTIQSAVIRKSRRSRKVPGGGIFPITSPPRRNHIPTNEEIGINSPRKYDEVGIFVDSQGVSLPPLTPTRHAQSSDQSLTPRIVNGAQVVEQGDNAMVQPGVDSHVNIAEEEESNVVKAAKFLLSLSPQSMSGDGLVSPTGECLLSTALDMGSPCEVIPSLSADMETKQTDRRFQQQESKGLLNAVWGEIGPQPVIGGGYAPTVNTSFKMLDPSVIESPIPTWDNCLFVKAEGARSGRIFLTHTDLIFIYEDDLSDSMLARYGWHREQIDALLLEIDVSSSRAATPVNVPLDASGEGGGVELIGSDNGTVNFMDLLEDCFEKSNYPESPTNANEEGNLVDKMEASECGECNNSSMASSLTPNNALNTSIHVQKKSSEAKYAGDGRSTSPLTVDDRRRHHYLDDLPPISLSSSSLDSLVDYEQSNCRDSNEDAVNHCIISAINEEAHMRLQEDERTASFSAAVDRADTSNNKTGTDQDYTTLYGNHTNISSFSEIDMEIDPDQESSLYISGELDTKRKYIGMKCPLSKLAEIFDRRYMMKEVGVEIFAPSPSQLTTSSIRQATTASASTVGGNLTDEIDVQLGPLSHHSIFLVIPGFHGKNVSRFRRKEVPRRDTFVEALKGRTNRLNDAHWQGSPRLQRKWHWRRNDKTYPLSALTRAWRKGHISNFDYLLRLNTIAGRTFHDPGNYPVMPWVLSNYTSTSVPDLSDERNFRDLSKPMGALCPKRLRKFQEKYAGLCACLDTAIPPFMYGSHYSNTGGVVLHYLVRVRPFAGLHRQLQGGQFDLPDRLFRSVAQTWDICSRTSTTEVKELTPEWYFDPSFLQNCHGFNLGTSAGDGAAVSDVVLPPWAHGDPTKFVEVMRNALESDYCSEHLPNWIDLIFGSKQRGPEAEKSNNLFYHLTYYDSDDLAKIEDETLRTEIELHIVDFGSCPAQLFPQPHPSKKIDRKSQSELHFMKN